MKTKTLLLFALLVCLNGIAQDTLPPVFEMRDTSKTIISDSNWQMLENKQGKIVFPEVTRTSAFHANTTEKEGMGYNGVKDYWIRWRMQNLTGANQEIVFARSNGNYKRDYYVLRSDGKVEHLRTGWGVPLSQRDTFRTRTGVLIEIRDTEMVTIYARVRLYHNNFFNKYDLSFTYKDRYIREEYIGEKLYLGDTRAASTAGLLILGFILNLFFYRIAKDKVYLYYGMVLLLEGLWFLLNGTWLFFKETPELSPWFD